MYGPPTIPALGGGLLSAGIIVGVGHYAGAVYAMSLFILALFVFSIIKLINGQRKARKLQKG